MAKDDLGQELPEVDPSGQELVYMAVANHIAGQIERGERAVGSRLPSELDLSNMWGVARMTTRRAIRELSERGLVRAVHGKGTFVTRPDS
ncbi:GntR family transcriptional regulator [Nonomuraea mesophila]|uniref:GntR family transcriptional regulator n=1 Tax=Nonomuraea mesophila TaxID=2530382 RepID=A0A4V2ZB76_9ACTN|nr:GntR family transcriptional regulator [Nonomuraea mesophila]TDE55652.1 GntR family transcriptional regulator [Nonomuraea mesophila]